jgi:hypothetical protein
MPTFKELSEAFRIFSKYTGRTVAYINVISILIDKGTVSEEDNSRLTELGWYPNDDGSSRFV